MARRVKEVVEEKVEPIVEEKVEPKKTTKRAAKKNNVKIAAPRVNIRKEASLNSDVLMIALKDEKFEFVTEAGDFYEIVCDGQKAFVMKEFSTLA